ncbi:MULTISPECIES: FUSC family protein [Acidovorax]|uniref:Fusaric acid resistance protein-like n=2 Tax=Acidovorax soli TaxID=592050 RepID=A0A1H3X8Y1_9BURK|nr:MULTISPECIES: FUSC family protein [Acidovorax]SDZ95028.1 Fusaric acid resistance protein-like [Acidovorax soli]
MTDKNTPARKSRRHRGASHGTSARHLVSPAQWRESMAIGAPPSPRIFAIAGFQAALAVLLAIVATHFSPWPQLVGFASLGALAALFGRFATVERRMRIVVICALLLALGVLVPSLASWAGAPPWMMAFALALVAGAATVAVSWWGLGGPGAVIIVFAAGAAYHPVGSGAEVLARVLATLAGGVVAVLTCLVTDRWRAPELKALRLPPAHVAPWSHQWIAAGRITACAALAAWIAFMAGWQHPAWAAIGAVSVLQGGHLHITMNRALQRMAGTIVGSFIVWAMLAQQPSFWMVVAAIVVFQFLTEVVIGYNYALGQITVTPMALLMTYLASPAVAASMPVERVLDTILGAALGIVFAVIFSSVDDRVYLHEHHSKDR